MPTKSDIEKQLALERERRARLGVPAAAGGVLLLLSAIIVNAVVSSLPSVGLLQGLKGALQGESTPAVSARAAEVKVLSHHVFGLIAGSVLEAIALALLTVTLLFVLDCTRFRRPETTSTPRTLVLIGGVGLAVLGVAVQIIRSIRTHDFAIGHNFSEHAVEQALTHGTANVIVGYLGLLVPLLLTVGMIITLLNATRAGLITRWLRGLGLASALMLLPFFAQILYLQLIPAAWMVAMGFLFMGKLPNGEPPTWETGEAQPWPSQAELRAKTLEQKQQGASKRGRSASAQESNGKTAVTDPDGPPPTDAAEPTTPQLPAQTQGSAAKRRRRKRR